MTVAEANTPPQLLFRELIELGNLMFNMLTGPHVTVKRWSAYYLVYMEVERLCLDLSQTTGYLARPFIEPDGRLDTRRIEGVNACLARIDSHFRTLVDLLARIERQQLVSYHKPALEDVIRIHFLPESAWYQACQAHYCAGRVAPDGLVLARMALLFDPYPICQVADIQQKNLLQRQRFRLLPTQSRTLLGRTSREVQVKLNQVYAGLGAFFVANCPSVKELLHPSMD
jgi:hypothetical protein